MTNVRMYWFAILAGALAGCAAGRPPGTDDWRPLFNGKDLSDWQVKCKPADSTKSFWRVDAGTILADSIGHKDHDYVWLVSKQEYGDFDLRLKFQAFRDSPGNSGVQIRSRYDEVAGYLDGPQVDINPAGPWRTGMVWDETRGSQRWLYPNVPKGKWVDESMSPKGLRFFYSDEAGGWNDMEIRANGTKFVAVLNGIQVMSYDGAGVLNDTVHREHNVGVKGFIALQIHKGDELKIRFKDIEIREPGRPPA